MNDILNIAAYKFVPLHDTPALCERLSNLAVSLELKGTVLLAQEGINLFLAGAAPSIRQWLQTLRQDVRFADLEAKESWSEHPPFKKMRVRIKREIIRMNHPAISPACGRAPAVTAATLKRWLDQGHDDAGQPVVTLDTRNDFEVDEGSFAGAMDWRIRKFTEFPEAFISHQQELHGKTVVSFCTGGIRCEKAVILMQEAGMTDVYQLEGGILKYLEETGGEHFKGNCFVFDERRALQPDLLEKKV